MGISVFIEVGVKHCYGGSTKLTIDIDGEVPVEIDAPFKLSTSEKVCLGLAGLGLATGVGGVVAAVVGATTEGAVSGGAIEAMVVGFALCSILLLSCIINRAFCRAACH